MSNEIQISVINVQVETVPTAKSSYQKAEVTYKNKSFQDKVEAKKLTSFAEGAAFNVLKDAQFGDEFFVSREKNDKGYWTWTKLSKDMEQPVQLEKENKPMANAVPAPKSTYETAEERQARQVMIVRQSSISNAIATLSVNAGKDKLQVEDILITAKAFEAYVLGIEPELEELVM